MFDDDTLARANLDLKKEEEIDISKSVEKQRIKDTKIPDKEFLARKGTICTDPNYNIYKPLVKHIKRYLPFTVRSMMGCEGCEWRGTSSCPHGIQLKKLTDKALNDEDQSDCIKHGNGICEYRIDYLVWIGGEWDKRPTHDQWMSRYHKRTMDLVNGNDYKRMEKVRHEYESMEQDETVDKKELEIKRKELWFARKDWIELAKLCQETTDRQVDRETPKNIEMNIEHHVKPSDVTKILNKANKQVIDAEYTEDKE